MSRVVIDFSFQLELSYLFQEKRVQQYADAVPSLVFKRLFNLFDLEKMHLRKLTSLSSSSEIEQKYPL